MTQPKMPQPKYRGERCAWLPMQGLPPHTFDKFLSVVQNKPSDDVSEGTAGEYERNIRYFINWLQDERDTSPLEVDVYDLEAYLMECRQDGDSNSTTISRRSAISRFYGELPGMVGRGEIDVDPDAIPQNPEENYEGTWTVSETKKQMESGEGVAYLTPEEVTELWQNVPAPKFRNRLIIRLGYQTGMRAGEISNIRYKRDLDLENRTIKIPASTSKGASRTVAYKATLDSDIRRWVDGGLRRAVPGAEDSPYLFPTAHSEQISTSQLYKIVKKAADDADLNQLVYQNDKTGRKHWRVSPHILRHSMAINTLDAGTMNVRELQDFLGHQDLETTEIYLEIASDDAVDKYLQNGGPPEV